MVKAFEAKGITEVQVLVKPGTQGSYVKCILV